MANAPSTRHPGDVPDVAPPSAPARWVASPWKWKTPRGCSCSVVWRRRSERMNADRSDIGDSRHGAHVPQGNRSCRPADHRRRASAGTGNRRTVIALPSALDSDARGHHHRHRSTIVACMPHGAGRWPACEERTDPSKPSLGGQHRQALQRSRHAVPRPHPGGQPRASCVLSTSSTTRRASSSPPTQRGGSARPSPAQHRRPGAHHSHPGAHGREHESRAAHAAPDASGTGARANARRAGRAVRADHVERIREILRYLARSAVARFAGRRRGRQQPQPISSRISPLMRPLIMATKRMLTHGSGAGVGRADRRASRRSFVCGSVSTMARRARWRTSAK